MHVVVTDLREELVAYVNGSPYLRRELEMPSAALHHAGQTPSPPLAPPPPPRLPSLSQNPLNQQLQLLKPCLMDSIS